MKKGQLAFLTSSHLVDDFYQGAIPASLPFLMADRHYSYAAVAGLAFASNGISSLLQPLFGLMADRSTRSWLVPAGFCTAAVGISAVGFVDSYLLTWLLIALSGIGIAAFHPSATSLARAAGGSSQTAMSTFSVGGTVGSAMAPPILAFLIGGMGLSGSWLLAAPAAAWAILWAVRGPWARWRGYELVNPVKAAKERNSESAPDDWRSFSRLVVVIMGWSIPFVAVTSMVALHAQRDLHQSESIGGVVLTCFTAAQIVGMLGGGWLGDRNGRMSTIRWGYLIALPALAGIAWSPSLPVLILFAIIFGAAMFLSFAAQVTLAQDYLPGRPGTASGLTLGMALAAGGLVSPLLGWFADAYGLPMTFYLLVAIFVIPVVLALRLPDRSLVSAEDSRETITSSHAG